jgi:hypothetical protein
MDVTEMEFQAGEFDAIIDKGTIDSILVGTQLTKVRR